MITRLNDMNASPQLLASAEGLYETFAPYPLPGNTNPCPCCHNEKHDARLRSKPLRSLSPEDLQDYASDAILVWGDDKVFKHFLPRLFELFVTVPNPSRHLTEPEILFSKLRHAEWHTWPAKEQAAVRDFLHCLWSDVLRYDFRYDNDFEETESCICSIAQAEDDLSPYFDQWIEDETLEACLTLSGLLLQSAVVLASNAGRNSFWDGRDQQYEHLKKWVHSAAVAGKLESAASRWADAPEREELLSARSILG